MVLLVTTGYYWVLGGTGWYRGALGGGIAGYWGYWEVIEDTGWYYGVLWGTAGIL